MKKNVSLFDILSNTSNTDLHYPIVNNYIDFAMADMRIPYHASLELSPICNLNCQMCYIRMSPEELANSGHKFLRFSDWKFFIDGLCSIGTENFVLTGGECMLHPDFMDIYNYIYDLGKSVTMITNGSCLTEQLLDLFVSKPPKNIFLTIYGTSKEVYERFCQNGSAWNAVDSNIKKLKDKKMPLHLLCTLGKGNEDDLNNIRHYAEQQDLSIRIGTDLINYDKCDEEKIYNSQINLFEKKKSDFEVRASLDSFDKKNFYTEYIFPEMENVKVYAKGIACAAAKNVCSISWRGTMRPCVTFEPFSLDPRTDGGIKECWQRIVDWGNNVPRIIECQKCLFRKECMPCLARHYNETHKYGKVSEKHCFKVQHPEEAAKLQAEYDRRQAEKAAAESNNVTEQGDL